MDVFERALLRRRKRQARQVLDLRHDSLVRVLEESQNRLLHTEGNTMITGTWSKIKDKKAGTETWGVRLVDDAAMGDEVDVVNRAGEVTTVTLGKRAAKFDDASLWHIQRTLEPKSPPPPPVIDYDEEPF